MIENILIIDTETTGLDPGKGAQVIEIAAVLFNLKHKSVLQSYATLLPCDENPVENINHIKAEATRANYSQFSMLWILGMFDYAQACVAHNAQFDMKFIETLDKGDVLLNKKWICTKKDFKWPVPLPRNRLQDICEAMGVQYLNAHRALADCLLLAQCFEKVEDLEERFNRC